MANDYSKRIAETIEANKEKYIDHLLKLVSIDTHDIGHGIEGGLEGNGQRYLEEVFREMNADEIVEDPLTEEAIQKCAKYNEGNTGHNYDDRFNVYATIKGSRTSPFSLTGTLTICRQTTWKAGRLIP